MTPNDSKKPGCRVRSNDQKPKYSELLKALDTLRQWVDASVLDARSVEEIRYIYAKLFRASEHAEKLVRRANIANDQTQREHL